MFKNKVSFKESQKCKSLFDFIDDKQDEGEV